MEIRLYKIPDLCRLDLSIMRVGESYNFSMKLPIFLVFVAATVVDCQSRDEQPFSEVRKHCNGRLDYKTMKRRTIGDEHFVAYANISGSSESDCTRKCFERTDFCAAAKYMPRERMCVFSFKWLSCKLGDDGSHARRTGSSSPNVLHCIQCDGEVQRVTKERKPEVLPVHKPEPSTVRRQQVTRRLPNTRTTTTRRPTTRTTTNTINNRRPPTTIVSKSTRKDLRTKSSESGQTRDLLPATTTFLPTTAHGAAGGAFTSTRPSTPTPWTPTTHASIFSTRPDFSNPIFTNCESTMMRPCLQGFGRGCSLFGSATGCPICSCPYKSPARGCAGPQGLSEIEREAMLMGGENCTNGREVQTVHRWYRKVDKQFGIDRCVQVKEPYCGWLQDVNIWRMPRTVDECNYFCYSDEELKSRGIRFFRI